MASQSGSAARQSGSPVSPRTSGPPSPSPKKEFISIKYDVGASPGLERRVRSGEVVIGRLRVFKKWSIGLAFARSKSFPCDVVINTRDLRGPALHDDVVAVELLPRERWQVVGNAAGTAGSSSPAPSAASSGNAPGAAKTADSSKQQGGSAAKEGEENKEDAGGEEQLMPLTLPDGRCIVRCIRSESEEQLLSNLPPEVRLPRLMGAPKQFDWPRGVRPIGRVVAVLWRRLEAYQVARVAEGAVQPGQLIRDSQFYRFKLYNPLLPVFAVGGRDIPAPMHADLCDSLFLLKLFGDANGALSVVTGDIYKAHLQSLIGKADSVEANNSALRSTYNLPDDTFPEDAEACVPPSYAIPDAAGLAREGRRDLRDEEFVCTIDPATARDLDDALSIRRNPGGGYHVGVHIANVSFFVQPGSALDEEARERSTSTYLVDKVIPMLPRKLSEDYCSLNPAEDKLAFSALFEMDREGHVVSEWFGQSVIRSRCRLAYEQAQQILDGEEVELDLSKESARTGQSEVQLRQKVYQSVKLLYELAAKRRAQSLARGRLSIGGFRLAFVFEDMNSKLSPHGFYVSRQIDANWLVEEFMLLANARVAEKIVQYLPDGALLRNHLPPKAKKISALKESLTKCGVQLVGSSAKGLQETLQGCKGHPHYDALCELTKYCLESATYLANDVADKTPRSHFALGLPWYTHFTSPIRRYCDIIVHRQLLVALELEQRLKEMGIDLPTSPDVNIEHKPGEEPFTAEAVLDPETLDNHASFYPLSEVELIAANANVKKEDARQAGEKSQQFFFCLYLQALEKKAQVDPTIPRVQCTPVVILKLSDGSVLLFSEEIVNSVEIGLADTRQRFTLIKKPLALLDEDGEGGQKARKGGPAGAWVDGQGREIDTKQKAHRRDKGGKSNMPSRAPAPPPSSSSSAGGGGKPSGPSTSTVSSVTVSWGINPATGEEEQEQLQLFSELVAQLEVVSKEGRMTLNMLVLPPWEREAFLKRGARIPTMLYDKRTGDEAT